MGVGRWLCIDFIPAATSISHLARKFQVNGTDSSASRTARKLCPAILSITKQTPSSATRTPPYVCTKKGLFLETCSLNFNSERALASNLESGVGPSSLQAFAAKASVPRNILTATSVSPWTGNLYLPARTIANEPAPSTALSIVKAFGSNTRANSSSVGAGFRLAMNCNSASWSWCIAGHLPAGFAIHGGGSKAKGGGLRERVSARERKKCGGVQKKNTKDREGGEKS